VNPGEHFKDLDMLSKLLATQKELDTGVERAQIKKSLIEELDFDDLRNQLEEETEEGKNTHNCLSNYYSFLI
jgi:hypothetical protein